MMNERMQARAFEIADDAMRTLIECECRRIDEIGVFYAPLKADGGDAASLTEAGTDLIEACEWIDWRGLGEVVDSPDGPVIIMFYEAGE